MHCPLVIVSTHTTTPHAVSHNGDRTSASSLRVQLATYCGAPSASKPYPRERALGSALRRKGHAREEQLRWFENVWGCPEGVVCVVIPAVGAVEEGGRGAGGVEAAPAGGAVGAAHPAATAPASREGRG
jgi:hypothetical protein